ncbi:MAG: prephenate dehydrogenase/arogenate dehydrogenase family protein [Magnetococcales bacterium]|nr:prephenate dehydrogenase/arogenate dehydrogenase family protein [Magnetococcales bacterium]
MSFFVNRLTIIGVGLIGGSLAQSLREQGLVGEVVGVNRSAASREMALEMGVVDRATDSITDGVQGATMVLVATPVRSIAQVVAQMAPSLSRGAVVTDVGSVKGSIVAACEPLMPEGCWFVGGHPIAGRERVGVSASFPSLFQGSRTILTPTDETHQPALELVRLVWEAAGSRVETMGAEYHDQVLAATSHLPHLMAYNVVNTLSDQEEHIRAEVFRYAAGGFRDFTRIASSDPTMWRDICLENSEAILLILERFRDNLDALARQVKARDGEALFDSFDRSKTTRDRVLSENKILHTSPLGED